MNDQIDSILVVWGMKMFPLKKWTYVEVLFDDQIHLMIPFKF